MAELTQVLRHLPRSQDANLLAGENPADDAAVYRLTDDLALVQTVDFFTPIVDDPYTYGQIAAANSLSDVYAMGGTPITALNIVAFPIKTLPAGILEDILRGGAEKAAEAGVPIVGGHTVEDEEPKYGLAVTGTVHPRHFLTARGARAGDVLVLTKPVGTGVISTALKAGAASKAHLAAAVRWMTTLNRDASRLMVVHGAHAATDITGFGLLGHLADMCSASGVSATVSASRVPLLPGAIEYARQGFVPAGSAANFQDLGGRIRFQGDVPEVLQTLLSDAQTSGGLLLSLPPEQVRNFVRSAQAHVLAAAIGKVGDSSDRSVAVVS
ncbi:MAG: selenide, water dikinase SelD [Chloroflexota bacterium]|nr:selenide, water dikinase SelD [Chloroflexota bacterium]